MKKLVTLTAIVCAFTAQSFAAPVPKTAGRTAREGRTERPATGVRASERGAVETSANSSARTGISAQADAQAAQANSIFGSTTAAQEIGSCNAGDGVTTLSPREKAIAANAVKETVAGGTGCLSNADAEGANVITQAYQAVEDKAEQMGIKDLSKATDAQFVQALDAAPEAVDRIMQLEGDENGAATDKFQDSCDLSCDFLSKRGCRLLEQTRNI